MSISDLARTCTVCELPIRVMAFRGDDTCSDDCAKALAARCCDGGHTAMGCTSDAPFTLCCWRCPAGAFTSMEDFRDALVRAGQPESDSQETTP